MLRVSLPLIHGEGETKNIEEGRSVIGSTAKKRGAGFSSKAEKKISLHRGKIET